MIAQCPLNLGDGDGAANLLANRSRAWLSINDMIERSGWVIELLDRMEERGREKKKGITGHAGSSAWSRLSRLFAAAGHAAPGTAGTGNNAYRGGWGMNREVDRLFTTRGTENDVSVYGRC